MNVLTEVIEMLHQWVRKAEHDLEAAARILAIREPHLDDAKRALALALQVRAAVLELLPPLAES